jgi:hypothetical protein
MSHVLEADKNRFRIKVADVDSRLEDVLAGFTAADRIGLVVRSPFAGFGASALVVRAVIAFYQERSGQGEVYPDFFLFAVGRPLGDHSMLEIWPEHHEVVVPPDAELILQAVNDRAITHLLVEDGDPSASLLSNWTMQSARGRIRSCLAFSPSGRARDADVEMANDAVAEGFVASALDPDRAIAEAVDGGFEDFIPYIRSRVAEVDQATRAAFLAARAPIRVGEHAVESYRRISLDEAFGLLSPAR